MHTVHPTAGEQFYLRILLHHLPARSYNDLKIINNIAHNTFQSAAVALGYFSNEQSEAEFALKEAIDSLYTPFQLRILFIHLLVNDCIQCPLDMWRKFYSNLSYDYLLTKNNDFNTALTATLQHISVLLQEYGKHLSDFGLEELSTHSGEIEYELSRWRELQPALHERASQAVAILNEGMSRLYFFP